MFTPGSWSSRCRSLLNIETHLWVRAVSRLLRGISHQPAFGWYGEAPRELDPYAPDADVVVADNRHLRLPAIYRSRGSARK